MDSCATLRRRERPVRHLSASIAWTTGDDVMRRISRFGLSVGTVVLALVLSLGCNRTRTPSVPIDPPDDPPAGPVVGPVKSDTEQPAGAPETLAKRVGDDSFAAPEEKIAALNALHATAPELIDKALWNAL